MATYIINYDLITPGKNYEELYKAIKSYGTWAHPLESCWLVVSNSSVATVRDHLKSHLDNNDKILVVKSSGSGAWSNLSDHNNWLKNNL